MGSVAQRRQEPLESLGCDRRDCVAMKLCLLALLVAAADDASATLGFSPTE
jgi:hypothetical protein